jgi:hypothetical protein
MQRISRHRRLSDPLSALSDRQGNAKAGQICEGFTKWNLWAYCISRVRS